MTTWSIVFGLVAGCLALWSIRADRWAATGAVAVGWLGLLVIGGGLHVGSVGTAGVPQWVPTWSFEGLAAMVAMAACAPSAVLPAMHGGETDTASSASAGVWSILIAVAAAVWPESWAMGAYREGAVLIAAHGSALAAALSVASAAAGASVARWLGHQRGDADVLSRRAVVLAWLTWPLAELVHWRIIGTPAVGSPAEWFALGTVLLATGLVILSPRDGETDRAQVLRRTIPVAVFVVLAAGVGISLSQGGWFGLSLPM